MSKFTRLIAAGITSVVALGVLAAPAMAEDAPEPFIDVVCATLTADRDEYIQMAQDSQEALEALIDQVEPANADLNASSTGMGEAALAYINALDEIGNVNATLNAFNESVNAFAEDLLSWIELTDQVANAGLELGVNQSVANYYVGVCGAPAI